MNHTESPQESHHERNNREWDEMLQELRVIQTGTQILAGFLLTIAFHDRFRELDGFQVFAYLTLVVLAVLATVLALVPVALHRAAFRADAKGRIVPLTNRILAVVLALVGLTLAGTAAFIFDLVAGWAAGWIVGLLVLLLATAVWVVFPARLGRRLR